MVILGLSVTSRNDFSQCISHGDATADSTDSEDIVIMKKSHRGNSYLYHPVWRQKGKVTMKSDRR